jgi:hypothetical protein
MQPARTRSATLRFPAITEPPTPSFAVPTIEGLDEVTNAIARCPNRRSRCRRTLQFHSSEEETPAPGAGRLGA